MLQQAARQNQSIHPQAVIAIANGRKALDSGRFEHAVKAFRKAVTLAPRQSAIHYALGLACIKAQRPMEAIAPMQCARDLAPNDYDCQLGLADAYYLSQQPAHALPEYVRAATLNAKAVLPWSNAGALYRESGRPELALDALAKALTIDPTHAGALCNSALALHDLGEFAAARDSVELALQSRPDYPEAYWNRALLDLLNGDFARGWAGHEFRTVQLAKQGGLRTFPQPRWTGERFEGKRLLLWPEQGLGDQLQFVRFLPRVKQLGGTVVLACSAPLLSLFRANCADAAEIVVIGESFAQVDFQLPLMSIPYVLQLKSRIDGDRVPYLRQNGEIGERFNHALPVEQPDRAGPLRVGIAWAGQPKHVNDRNRSLTLDVLRPLLSVPNIEWYSLQKGDAPEAQLEPFNLASRELKQPSITALGPVLTDFNDTAHAVERLDLVISVDTSVAHLAGAMNVPVWMLIPFVPDWRWQVKRSDSPWYPSARLFRQSTAGNWAGVMTQVVSALEGQSRAKSDRAAKVFVSRRAA